MVRATVRDGRRFLAISPPAPGSGRGERPDRRRSPWGSSVSPAAPAPHDDHVCPQFLGERGDLLGRELLSQVDPGNGAASVLYRLDLLIE